MILGHAYGGEATDFIYSGGEYTFVLIPGWVSTYPLDINNNNIVAGWGDDGPTTKGFVFDGVKYTFLLPYGWKNASVYSINDSNIVAGSGTDSNGATLCQTRQSWASARKLHAGLANPRRE